MEFNVTQVDRGSNLRRVFVTFPNVAPPGADFSSRGEGRKMELTSFRGGAVEVYVESSTGIMMYQGTVRDYFPTESGQKILRAVWYAEQKSAAARASFEASCERK